MTDHSASEDRPTNPAILARLGVEIWRLGQRLRRSDTGRLPDSHERIARVFEELGGTIEDRAGEPFIDGMDAEILHQPDGIDPSSGSLYIAEVIRPAISVHGKRELPAQLILMSREESLPDDGSATHD